MRALVLVALVLGAGLMAGAAKAAPTPFDYPAEARAVVRHGGDDTWIATPQSSALDRLEIRTIAGRPSMVCVYWLFGQTYWIHRPFPERHRCEIAISERRFYCAD